MILVSWSGHLDAQRFYLVIYLVSHSNHKDDRGQCSIGTGTHRNAVPVLFWTTGKPFRSFSYDTIHGKTSPNTF